MANIKLPTIRERLQTMKRVDNRWADCYVRDVAHLLSIIDSDARYAAGLQRGAEIAEAENKPVEDHDQWNAGYAWAAESIAEAIRKEIK